jgi:hypothetical protein
MTDEEKHCSFGNRNTLNPPAKNLGEPDVTASISANLHYEFHVRLGDIKIRFDVTKPAFSQFSYAMRRSGNGPPALRLALQSPVLCCPEDKPLHDDPTGCSSW